MHRYQPARGASRVTLLHHSSAMEPMVVVSLVNVYCVCVCVHVCVCVCVHVCVSVSCDPYLEVVLLSL